MPVPPEVTVIVCAGTRNLATHEFLHIHRVLVFYRLHAADQRQIRELDRRLLAVHQRGHRGGPGLARAASERRRRKRACRATAFDSVIALAPFGAAIPSVCTCGAVTGVNEGSPSKLNWPSVFRSVGVKTPPLPCT